MNFKKKKIIIILISIIILTIVIAISYFFLTKNINNPIDITKNEDTKISKENEEDIKEIQIYDIEEGYLVVPYNKNATKHSYDWNNLSTNKPYYKYNDEAYETKFGIDVSSFQKNVNWEKVKNAGVDFVFIRLGYRGYGKSGKLVLDSQFEEHYKQASKYGINIGVYFFSQAISEKEAIEEANFVLKHIKNKNITYPICFDLEKIKFDTARTDNLTYEQITKMTLAFCKEIENAGYTPLIYGNAKFFTTKMQLEQFNNYQKWYADYQTNPLYPYEFSFWQYTEDGYMDGITGKVDFNLQFVRKK